MASSEFWIVAGPNGAGKTTCVQKQPISQILPQVQFFNPDDRTLEKLRALGYQGFGDAPIDVQARLFLEAADEVFQALEMSLEQGAAVGVETVLSSQKYCPLVTRVRDNAGFVGLIYVSLSSPMIAKRRVAARVLRGGHGVPSEKIEQRWTRSLDYLAWFAANASAFWIIDNSDSTPETPPVLLASGKNGRLEHVADVIFPEMKATLAKLP